MPIELSRTGGGIVICTVAGKLVRSDYERFSSRFDGMLQQHGKLRVLFEMKDFHGWEPSALWDEIKAVPFATDDPEATRDYKLG